MRKLATAIAIVLVMGLGGYLYVKKTSSAVYPPTEVTIHLTPNVASSLIWVAHEAGYFKEQNLHTNFKVFDVGKLALDDLLVNPDVDYVFVYETPIVKKIIDGKELRLLTGLHTSNRNTRLIMKGVKPESEHDGLVGKRIGVQLGTHSDFALSELLSRNGMKTSEIKVVDMPGTAMPERSTTNEVDGVMVWNPFYDEAIQNLKAQGQAFWEPKLGYYYEHSFLVTDSARAQKNAQLSLRVLAALHKAYQLYKTDPIKFAEHAGAFAPVGLGKDNVVARLADVDLVFGLNNKMAQALQMELQYFCVIQAECNLAILQQQDLMMDTAALERVAPLLNQYKHVR